MVMVCLCVYSECEADIAIIFTSPSASRKGPDISGVVPQSNLTLLPCLHLQGPERQDPACEAYCERKQEPMAHLGEDSRWSPIHNKLHLLPASSCL
jgi:hypothetical protein